ncbi:MAG: hypothetical protein WB762_06005 [Candidatus Sulfotelmatobacter sp.]
MTRQIVKGLVLAAFVASTLAEDRGQASSEHPIKTVRVIVMENQNWSSIQGNRSAPYMNQTLLPIAFHAEQYFPPNNHPSLPNYLWIEAGTNFGILHAWTDRRHFPKGQRCLLATVGRICGRFHAVSAAGRIWLLSRLGLPISPSQLAIILALPAWLICRGRPPNDVSLERHLLGHSHRLPSFIRPHLINTVEVA